MNMKAALKKIKLFHFDNIVVLKCNLERINYDSQLVESAKF